MNTTDEVRLDIWLWSARFFKTRSLSKEAIESGKIDVNGVGAKPAKALRVGDEVRIVRGEERFEIVVVALARQRGPAEIAQGLYAETEASKAARDREREQRRLAGADLSHPQKRPDKRSRRLIRRFQDSV
jgi:ribosome-associated heat shock protein Hsp15